MNHAAPKPRPQAQHTAAQCTGEAAKSHVLQVPDRLKPAFDRLLELVAQLDPAHRPLYLGGGTMLACRWGHRISTDLDLHVRHTDIAEVGPALHQLLQAAAAAEPNAFASPALYGHPHAVAGRVLGAECTLFPGNHLRADEIKRDFVGNRNILAETNEEVMLGKVSGRLRMIDARHPMLPIRDLYDIAVGGVMDPNAVQVSLVAIPTSLRGRIATALANIPRNLHELDPKPLIEPTWDVELAGLAQQIAPAVRHASVDLLPPCAPMEATLDAPP